MLPNSFQSEFADAFSFFEETKIVGLLLLEKLANARFEKELVRFRDKVEAVTAFLIVLETAVFIMNRMELGARLREQRIQAGDMWEQNSP